MIKTLRQALGVLLFDGKRYMQALKSQDSDWLWLCNRYESLLPSPNGLGVYCDWEWTSDLHAPKIFPWFGQQLMKRALKDYPIILARGRECFKATEHPNISFIIGHRGKERLSHLLLTLRSIATQQDVGIECIVVEQSTNAEIHDQLPGWVKYVHISPPNPDMPYCRSWAFNVGARIARGNTLVLHDNDLLIPQNYAAEHLAKIKQGWEIINLKRFIFYLNRDHTQQTFESKMLRLDKAPERIIQNAQGGGSLVINRESYFRIGGFDEQFVGWGGEDNELWERAQGLKVYPYGYLPMIHLWHAGQPGKKFYQGRGRETAKLFELRAALSPSERITELIKRDFGNPRNLTPMYSPT